MSADERYRRLLKGTIASGQAVSNAINIEGLALLGIAFPAAWDAAAITFEGSVNGTTWAPVYDDAGNELTIASGVVTTLTGKVVVAGGGALEKLAALYAIKIRSGTAASPVNQTAERVFNLIGKA